MNEKPGFPNAAIKAKARAKLVSSKPDYKATKAAAKKVPQRDGLAKMAKAMQERMR